MNPNWIVPIGTKIVAAALAPGRPPREDVTVGAVGIIVSSPVDPQRAYRVRFVDGVEAPLMRAEFELLKIFQSAAPSGGQSDQGACAASGASAIGAPAAGATDAADQSGADEFSQYVIYRCIVGSRAYGLDHDESDTDRRGIYLPPADLHWSLWGVPEQIERHDTQECYWEFQKFVVLALKANPNILEVLYSPLAELRTPIADELLAIRGKFLSRMIYQTYNGYVLSQFRKLEQDLRTRGELRWKHAMHLIRLLLAGIAALRTGEVLVRVDDHRERLMEIRNGVLAWDRVNEWRLALHREFESAHAATTLPERPDYSAANELLIRARRSMV